MHTVVGAGKAEGSMDAGNMLKPMLARGELHGIGATTLDEYRKYIEKDAALERRFQPVFVGEPTVEDTIASCADSRSATRRITACASRTTRSWPPPASNRYIADRFLPDKAIDLIDEAASKLRIEIDSMPEEIDEVKRRVMQLEIERERSQGKRQGVERTTREDRAGACRTQGRATRLKAQWQQEKEAIQRRASSRKRSNSRAWRSNGRAGGRLRESSEISTDGCRSSSGRWRRRRRRTLPSRARAC